MIPYTTNLQLLLDASTLALSDGASVSTWADGSGAGRGASVPGGHTAPIFKSGANSFGVHPAVRFGGSAATALGGSLSGWSSGSATVFVGGRNYNGNAFGGIFSAYDSAQPEEYNTPNTFLIANDGSSRLAVYANTAIGNILGTPFGGTTVFSVPISAAGELPCIDTCQLAIPSNPLSALAPTNYLMGNRWTGGAISTAFPAIFDLGKLAVFSEVVSPTNKLAVVQWILSELNATGGGGGGLIVSGGMRGGMQ